MSSQLAQHEPRPPKHVGFPEFFAGLNSASRLSAEQERELFCCMNQWPTAGAQGRQAVEIRNRIFEVYRKLAISVVRRFATHTNVPLDDLMSEGQFTLLRAIQRFDPDRGFRFSTYVTRALRSNLCRYVTRSRRRRHGVLAHIECVVDSHRWSWQRERFTQRAYQAVLGLLNDIEPLDAMILRRRFGVEQETRCTLQKIADELNVSRERVRQLENRALRRIRQLAAERGIDDPEDWVG